MEAQENVVADLKKAMQMAPATITVVTAGNDADTNGLTATSVCSVSMDPPTILVCVNRDSNTHALIAESKKFCINILSQDQRHIAESFATNGTGQEKFQRADATLHQIEGHPAIQHAIANIACTLADSIQVGTHTIFIGHVQKIHLAQNADPLLYGNQTFGSFTPE